MQADLQFAVCVFTFTYLCPSNHVLENLEAEISMDVFVFRDSIPVVSGTSRSAVHAFRNGRTWQHNTEAPSHFKDAR